VLSWGAVDLVRKWPGLKSLTAAAGLICGLACLVAASAQAQYWRNSETLYQRAISVTTDNYVAQYSLAEYLMDIPGRGADAVSHFEAALRIKPDSADARNSIGAYLLQNGRDAEAQTQFEAALRVQPTSAEAHFNLGLILEKSPNHLADAIAHYMAAANAKPEWARAHKNLGMALLRLGRTPEALEQFEAAQRIQLDPEISAIMAGIVRK
jgi:Tfp pilus assembly protein PilF